MQKEQDKKVIIALSGSIAAYKICDLVRCLVKEACPVQVIMTANAERFVSKLTLQSLSGRRVLSSEWDEGMLHIDLKNEAALYAVMPATANCIGKLANGIADDIVSSAYLAVQCPVMIAPAMNPAMYQHPAVQKNLARLKEYGVEIIEPGQGEVLCGDWGYGKMAPVEAIHKAILSLWESSS